MTSALPVLDVQERRHTDQAQAAEYRHEPLAHSRRTPIRCGLKCQQYIVGLGLVHAQREPRKYCISFAMHVDQEYLEAVEELRGLQRPIPTKSDVIRNAVMEVLRRVKAKGKQ
jgi:hypothetical protein